MARGLHTTTRRNGRLSEVSTRFDSDSPDMTFRYEYLPGSDLVAGYSSGDFARKVAFERNRDLVLAVTNSFGSIIISFFDYKNAASGRRCSVRHGGTAYGPLAGSVDSYGYNSRSEVVSSRRTLNGTSVLGFNEDFSYDDIGNRLSAIHYDADGHAIVETYSANELNQYLQRSISDSSGNSLEEYDYDDDGNMTKDGRFHYFWNAENRLVCASNNENVVRYEYDWRGRMTAKTVFHEVGATENSRYLWDEWNIIRESSVESGAKVVSDNAWGLDIDGTLQGKGGIGGLLSVRRHDMLLLPTYAANGNVGESVSIHGDVMSHYDYSPFGKLICSVNDSKEILSFQYSTKPYCSTTCLSEFQFRCFNDDLGRWISRDLLFDFMLKYKTAFRIESDDNQFSLPTLIRNILLDFSTGIRDADGYLFCGNAPTISTDCLGLSNAMLHRGGCCNFSEEDEWALVSKGEGECATTEWIKLAPGECKGGILSSSDCEGMTCGGGFYKVSGLDVGSCVFPGCDFWPYSTRRWTPEKQGKNAASPTSRGGSNNYPPGYTYK